MRRVPFDPEMRKAMGEQAVAWAKGGGYESAGTVEFVVAPPRSSIPEMNTRLVGRAPGHRTDHRHRPGRADDPRGGGEKLPQ